MKVRPVRRIDEETYYVLLRATRGAMLDKIAKNDLYRKGLAERPKESERRTWLTDLGRALLSRGLPAPETAPSPEEERKLIEQTLRVTGGNESEAARQLGIRRGRLRRLRGKA